MRTPPRSDPERRLAFHSTIAIAGNSSNFMEINQHESKCKITGAIAVVNGGSVAINNPDGSTIGTFGSLLVATRTFRDHLRDHLLHDEGDRLRVGDRVHHDGGNR
jgi:hypothetical protein